MWKQVLLTIPLLLAIDMPFILGIMSTYKKYWPNQISRSFKIIPAMIVIYTLLALTLLLITTPSENPYMYAALVGATIYGVYSFTVYALVPEWPLWLASLETIWGALMMVIATFAIKLYIN